MTDKDRQIQGPWLTEIEREGGMEEARRAGEREREREGEKV